MEGQQFEFWFSDRLLAEATGVPLRALHFELEMILRAHEAVQPIAERLGVHPPPAKLPGFAYAHIAALDAKIEFTDAEPTPAPLLRSPEDIDRLREPGDYLEAGFIQQRLALAERLIARCPAAARTIGHLLEGPVTTAALLLGERFFLLPYEDPERAHRLLEFCVRSGLNYARAITRHFDPSADLVADGFPDDFGGIFAPPVFAEFVVPYWDRLYQGLQSSRRFLHSELLRVGHLPFLRELRVECYDPSADQYLTPELLRQHCPCRFQCRIQDWHVAHSTAEELQAMYRHLAGFRPKVISFCLSRLEDEAKIRALLDVARELRSLEG